MTSLNILNLIINLDSFLRQLEGNVEVITKKRIKKIKPKILMFLKNISIY